MIVFFNSVKPSGVPESLFKYINSVKILNLTKSRTWIKRMFDAGKIKPVNRTPVDMTGYCEQLFQVMDLMDSHYGSENWDFCIDASFSSDDNGHLTDFSCFLHPFAIQPNFIIRNSEGLEHEIRGLVTINHLGFKNGVLYPKKIGGTRLVLSGLEAKNGYRHSHLTSSSYNTSHSVTNTISDFCIGGDSELHDLLMEIEISQRFDIDMIDFYLTTVDTMVTWESLEGVPYFKMKGMLSNTEYAVSYTTTEMRNIFDNYVWPQLKIRESFNVDYGYSREKYRILNNTKLDETLQIVIGETSLDVNKYLVKRKPGTTQYYTAPGNTALMSVENRIRKLTYNGEMPYVYMNGSKTYLKIYSHNTDDDDASSKGYSIYPPLTEFIINKLENILYEKAVRRSVVGT